MRFDDDAADSSGNGNNGTLTNSADISYVNGKIGKAIKFGGLHAKGSVTVPVHSSITFQDEMTVAYWVRLDDHYGQIGDSPWFSQKGIHGVFVKGQEGNMSNYIFTGSNRSNLSMFGDDISATHPFTVGEWVHVSFTISSSARKAYINGIKVDEVASTPIDFTVVNAANLTIGWLSSDWYPLHGAIDDFRMYKRALNESDILALYNAGSK